MLIAFFRDESLVEQLRVRTGKVLDVNLDMMTVVGRKLSVGLAEHQMLPDADFDSRRSTSAVVAGSRGLGAHHVAIEPRNPVSGPFRHVEFDISDAERDAAETFIRRVTADAIPPRTSGLDESLVFLEIEARSGEPFASPSEPRNERLAIGNHDSSMTAHHLRRRSRQMELVAADVDPHVGRPGH